MNEGSTLCQINDKIQADIFLLSVVNFTLLDGLVAVALLAAFILLWKF